MLPLLFILLQAQTIQVNGGGKSAIITVAGQSQYTQCASYVTGTYYRHLYCLEGEVVYALRESEVPGWTPLSPGAAKVPLTECTVEYVDMFRRRVNCQQKSVSFGYVEGFILGTIHYQ